MWFISLIWLFVCAFGLMLFCLRSVLRCFMCWSMSGGNGVILSLIFPLGMCSLSASSIS